MHKQGKDKKCERCGSTENCSVFHFFTGSCDVCLKKDCVEKGEHTWDLCSLGGGTCSAVCMWCDATTDSVKEALTPLGFVEAGDVVLGPVTLRNDDE